MDSLTQIVLGGAIGEKVLGKKVGNKAVLWGAIGGTIPDLDTIPGQFLDTVSRLEIHRGFSHSIIFAILLSPLLGYLIAQLYRRKGEANGWAWTQLFFWAIFTHPLLDIFTTWGTQLLWPLEWRIAVQSIFVIDPIYTVPFLLCLCFAMILKRDHPKRRWLNQLGLGISSLYLLYTVGVKLYVDSVFEASLEKSQIPYLRFDSRPTAFNSILWTSNAETEDSYWISYYSLLDENKELNYYRFPKNEDLIKPWRNQEKVERLIFLTKGFYTLEKIENGVAMNDLRFGLTEGFDEGKGDFVFTYLIREGKEGLIVEQKEQNFEGMQEALEKLWQRILGNKN